MFINNYIFYLKSLIIFVILYSILFYKSISYLHVKSNLFNNGKIYETVKCLEINQCKQKCLKMKNTRIIQINYTNNDFPHPFPYNYYFLHYSVCKMNTYLFIYIVSECKQYYERMSIRLTWGRQYKEVTIRFIIGIGNAICNKAYNYENNLYKDILQINICESFVNETLFSLYIMKYLKMLCPNAVYYAKFDVDTFVNIQKILYTIKPYENFTNQFWGAEVQIWKKVNDNQKFKYSSPINIANHYNLIFPKNGIKVYSGFVTIFSSDLPDIIFNCSLKFPVLMRIDDQYISWLLYCLNIKIKTISSYAILPSKCEIYKNVTTIHRIRSIDMISFSFFYHLL